MTLIKCFVHRFEFQEVIIAKRIRKLWNKITSKK